MSTNFLFAADTGAQPVLLPAMLTVRDEMGLEPVPSKLDAMPLLGMHERGILNGVAACQLRYGQVEEALALLQLSNRLWPEDRQTLRLLTQSFIQIEDWASADMTEAAYQRLTAFSRPSRLDRLRQAFIHFGQARLLEARAALDAVLRSNKEAASS